MVTIPGVFTSAVEFGVDLVEEFVEIFNRVDSAFAEFVDEAEELVIQIGEAEDLVGIVDRIAQTPRDREDAICLTMLMAMEQDLEVTRKTGNATYSISRHVEILAALIAEAACLAQNQTV